MRLTGNPTKAAAVEIFTGGSTWGRICPVDWTLKYAKMVCNYFGYPVALSAIDIRADDPTFISNGSTTQNIIQMREEHIRIEETICRESTIPSVFANCTHTLITMNCECSTLNAGVICGNGNLVTQNYF